MEKVNLPHIDGVIGLPRSPQDRTWVFEQLRAEFRSGGEWIEDWEITKTRRDIEIIRYVEDMVWKYMRTFGRAKRLRVPLKNIHLLRMGGVLALSGNKLGGGIHTDVRQSIQMDRVGNDTKFALTLFHEVFHLMAFSVVRVKLGKKHLAISGWRQGLSSQIGRTKTRWYFKWGEEAAVEHMTERFYYEHLRHRKDFPKVRGYPRTTREGERRDMYTFSRIARKINSQKKVKNATRVVQLFCEGQANGRWLALARLTRRIFRHPEMFRKMVEYNRYITR